MTLLNRLFDVYIDLNIILALTATLWLTARFLMARSGKKPAFSVQLGLLNGLFTLVLLSPIVVVLFLDLQAADVVPRGYSVNLADYAVSRYLRGGIAIPAEDFQSLLGLRGRFTETVLTLSSPAGVAIASLLLVGSAFFTLRLCAGFVRLARMLSACHHWRRSGNVSLLLSDTALVPFSAQGLIRYYVVIPSDLLARPEDLKLVLKHEFQHLRQGDVAWEIGLEMLRPLFFWNPFYYLWKGEVERLRELACDQKVTEGGKVDLKAYCLCLVRAAQSGFRKRTELRSPAQRPADAASVALLDLRERFWRRSPSRKLHRRIEALVDDRPQHSHRGLVCLAVLPLAGVVLLTAMSLQKPADWSQDRLMLSAIVNLERLETINTLGQRPLR
ncbi:M56 family metallopeptidase [Rhodobacterales bacterium]|nr:M56 family metallopeptidase [Rhodobacterales bacterium]